MFALFIFIAVMVYMVPGLFVARSEYAKQVRAHGKAEPRVILPPKPPRPEYKMSEFLHQKTPFMCSLLKENKGYKACNCKYRDDWVDMKNQWLDYDEWMENYGHLESQASTVKAATVPLAAVPFWPVYFAKSFIEKGAVGIPDYKAVAEADRLLEQFQEEDNKKLEGK